MRGVRMSRARWLLAAGLCLALAAGTAVARLANVYLKDGTRLRGDVTVTDTEVIVRNQAGETRYPADRVARVEFLDAAESLPATAETQPTTTQTQPAATQPLRPLSYEAEYRKRFEALRADDLVGHFTLAEWLRDHEQYELLIAQCKYILELDPNHRNAQLLLEVAEEGVRQAEELEAARARERPRLAAPPPLSQRDIQILKLCELPLDGDPEPVRVRFKHERGATDLDTLVLRDLGSDPQRRELLWEQYRRADTARKLQMILDHTGLKYADRIEILGDPRVFAEFRRKVLPLVKRGCARSGCHGGPGSEVLRLPSRSDREEDVYATFLILDRIVTADGRLLNRTLPEDSTLLSYMLPTADNKHPHPPMSNKRVVPVLRSKRDPNYQMILDWISSLRLPHPAYPVEYAAPDWLAPLTEPPAGEPWPPDAAEPASRPAGDEAVFP